MPTEPLNLAPKSQLYLHNLVFLHDNDFDIQFEESLRKEQFKLLGWTANDPRANDKSILKPDIQEKSLFV